MPAQRGEIALQIGELDAQRAKLFAQPGELDIPISSELGVALDAMPATGHLTYLIAPKGAYSPEALGKKFAE